MMAGALRYDDQHWGKKRCAFRFEVIRELPLELRCTFTRSVGADGPAIAPAIGATSAQSRPELPSRPALSNAGSNAGAEGAVITVDVMGRMGDLARRPSAGANPTARRMPREEVRRQALPGERAWLHFRRETH